MIIDGRKISREMLEDSKNQLKIINFKPKLIDVLVGDDLVTESYVNIKAKRAGEIGIDFEIVHFSSTVTQEELESDIRELNKTEHLCGLIVQLPLPGHLDKQKILDAIDPAVDVDVITSENSTKFFEGHAELLPPTANAIFKILETLDLDLQQSKVLVVGAGDLVGKPTAHLLREKGAEVTVADKETENLAELCLNAEIIVSGAGVPKLITADMVKENTVIIDAGTAESAGGISGDVDFEAIKDKVKAISPVPGGVGPVTVAMLLQNVVKVAKSR